MHESVLIVNNNYYIWLTEQEIPLYHSEAGLRWAYWHHDRLRWSLHFFQAFWLRCSNWMHGKELPAFTVEWIKYILYIVFYQLIGLCQNIRELVRLEMRRYSNIKFRIIGIFIIFWIASHPFGTLVQQVFSLLNC